MQVWSCLPRRDSASTCSSVSCPCCLSWSSFHFSSRFLSAIGKVLPILAYEFCSYSLSSFIGMQLVPARTQTHTNAVLFRSCPAEEYTSRQKMLKAQKHPYFTYLQEEASNAAYVASNTLGFNKCAGWWQSAVNRHFRKKTRSMRSSFHHGKSLMAVKSTWDQGGIQDLTLRRALSRVRNVQTQGSKRPWMHSIVGILPRAVRQCFFGTPVEPMAESGESGALVGVSLNLSSSHWISTS